MRILGVAWFRLCFSYSAFETGASSSALKNRSVNDRVVVLVHQIWIRGAICLSTYI